MNVLMSSINYDYMDPVFAEIFRQISPTTCAVTFLDLESPDRFPQTKALADYAFCYQHCRNGWYQSQLFYSELSPLEPEIINKMIPYERDILLMLTRERPLEHRLVVREYYKHLRYWNHVLDRLNIDIYLAFILPHESYDAVIYFLCQAKGIPTVCLNMSNLPEYLYLVSDLKDPCPELRKKFAELKDVYREASLEDITFSDPRIKAKYAQYINPEADITPLNMRIFREAQKKKEDRIGKYQLIVRRLKLIRYLIAHVLRFDVETFEVFRKRRYLNHRFLEYEILLDYSRQNCSHPVDGEKYIYVPLHMQPEFTTAPLGGVFSDQLLMLTMLAHHLPADCFLYIKEHPGQRYQSEVFPSARHLEFYQDLVDLKNVRLMSLEEDTYSLIKNSIAVATVTGTAGFEAIARGKKFLMFGYQTAQYMTGVVPIRSNEDCAQAIRELTEDHPAAACSSKDFKIYLKAIEETCFYGTFWYLPEIHATLSEDELAESERNLIENYVARVRSLIAR
jgi:hypothetical protein